MGRESLRPSAGPCRAAAFPCFERPRARDAVTLGHITKASDSYIRSFLVLGPGSTQCSAAQNRTDEISRWATALAARRGYWRAIVAIAAKNVRMAWAVLSRGEQFAMPA